MASIVSSQAHGDSPQSESTTIESPDFPTAAEESRESTPFLPSSNNQDYTDVTLLKEKKCATKCVVVLSIVTVLMVLLFLASLGTGSPYLYVLQTVKPQNPEKVTHVDDTILLEGNLNALRFSNASIEQCGEYEDDHIAQVFVLESEKVKTISTQPVPTTDKYHVDSPSYKSGIIDWQYLLPQSNFTYEICLTSTTDHTQSATYFLFMGPDKYNNYVDNPDDGERYSHLSVKLTAYTNNETCTSISHPINDTAYYFMMLNTPGNVDISYNFTLHKVEYNITNFEITCNVSSSSSCSVSLLNGPLSQTKYNILVRVPSFLGQQRMTTLLCIKDYETSEQLITIVSVTFGAALLFLIVFLVLAGALVKPSKILYKFRNHTHDPRYPVQASDD